MSKKEEEKVDETKPKTKKVKKPKFKLVTYEMKAIIPTGMYANIQPCIVVQSDTLENAERAVMPHIEALFAKYRDGGAPVVTNPPVKPTSPAKAPTQAISQSVKTEEPKSSATTATTTEEKPAIILTVPFTRAKTAIESCTSISALNLIEDQVTKSVKLIDTEKQELAAIILKKRKELKEAK